MDDDQKKQAPALIKETDIDIPASGSGGTAQPPASVSAGPVERKNLAFQDLETKPSAEITPTGEQREVSVSPELTETGIQVISETPPSVPGIQPTGPLTAVPTESSNMIQIPRELREGQGNYQDSFRWLRRVYNKARDWSIDMLRRKKIEQPV